MPAVKLLDGKKITFSKSINGFELAKKRSNKLTSVERVSKIGVDTLCFEGINVLARSSTSLTIKTSFCPSTLTGTRRCMALISGAIEPAGSKIHAGIDHQDSTVITTSPLSTSNTHIINGLASLKIYDVRCGSSVC